MTSVLELVPSVARRADRHRTVGAAHQFPIRAAIRLEDDQPPRWVKPPRGAHGRHQIGIPGDEHGSVALGATDVLEEPRTDGDIGLLLLPADEAAPALGADQGLGLELAERNLHPSPLQLGEVGDLPRHRPRMPALTMVCDGGEIDDRRSPAAPGQRMQVRLAERGDIQLTQLMTCHSLRIEKRVVQIQTIDEEDTAVDDCLQKRKNPGVATPGGPRDIPVGENGSSLPSRRPAVKNWLEMSPFFPTPDLAGARTQPRRTRPHAALAITRPTSWRDAPRASKDLTSRSTETEASAASILATRD